MTVGLVLGVFVQVVSVHFEHDPGRHAAAAPPPGTQRTGRKKTAHDAFNPTNKIHIFNLRFYLSRIIEIVFNVTAYM